MQEQKLRKQNSQHGFKIKFVTTLSNQNHIKVCSLPWWTRILIVLSIEQQLVTQMVVVGWARPDFGC